MSRFLMYVGFIYAGAWLVAGALFFGLEPLWKFLLNL